MKSRFPLWLKVVLASIIIVAMAIGVGLLTIRWYVKTQMLHSGGQLSPAMAAYDVQHYGIQIEVMPKTKSIKGETKATVRTLASIQNFEINLDDRLGISRVQVDGTRADFKHEKGLISIPLDPTWAQGEDHSVTINYDGQPKVALKPPWIDGFVWSKTPSGKPWIGVTCQGDGADDWWPCKDHPSDEPDEGIDLSLRVPSDLVGLSNGRKVGEHDNGDGTTTTQWHVSYPINNYLVTLNIAPYVPIEEPYHGCDGTLDETLVFYSLPENVEKARVMWKQMPRILEVLGRRFGEYPFFNDKFAVANAPYLGMEHQTLVAYGDHFEDNEYGFDSLLLHEVSHEWWGNKVTAKDWADFWLHEGFAVYSEALYVNDTLGKKRYLDYMDMIRNRIRNRTPIVQGKNLTSAAAYNGDIYAKGAWVLHMLRYILGDDQFFQVLWRFSNDKPFAYGFVTSTDLINLVKDVSGGRDLSWFWNRYLDEAALPKWSIQREEGAAGDFVRIAWQDPAFEMPLPVRVGQKIQNLEMHGGSAEITVPHGRQVKVDPEGWVLATRAED